MISLVVGPRTGEADEVVFSERPTFIGREDNKGLFPKLTTSKHIEETTEIPIELRTVVQGLVILFTGALDMMVRMLLTRIFALFRPAKLEAA